MHLALADLIDIELGRRWYVRRRPALMALYEDRRELLYRSSTRLSLHLAGIVYISFSVIDALLIGDVARYSIIARFIIGSLYIIGTEALILRKANLFYIECHCAAATVIAFIAWLSIASLTSQDAALSYYLTYGIVFMLGLNVFFALRFTVAAISSTTILMISLIFLLLNYTQSVIFVVATGTLYLSTYALTLFVNWKLNEERYLVFLNSTGAEIQRAEAIERGAALLRLSTTDALTGLSNRRAVDDALRASWSNWQSATKSFAVILIDVDYFKLYNDYYGHQEGDKCLSAIANAMNNAVSDENFTLGRFGGEEFILIFRSPSREHVAAVAETMRHSVEAMALPHIQRPDNAFVVTVSVGAALSWDVPGTKVERLITEADRALYNAKNANRNCVRIYDRTDPNQLDIDENVIDLVRTALDQQRLSMVYQPIRDAISCRMVGVESLMRLSTPKGKSISPAVFIPIAERTGAIIPMGLWAIRTACDEMLGNSHGKLVSVNVSPVQLRSHEFAKSVGAILSETRVDPGSLAIEVTEGLQIEGQVEIIQALSDLRALGVKIWLDDFGTGFAGLSCVREVEFDAVKVDRSFLHATSTTKGQEMFANIIALVRNTGCRIVVEGVETAEQLEIAAGHKVDYVQGYFLGKPSAADGIHELAEREVA